MKISPLILSLLTLSLLAFFQIAFCNNYNMNTNKLIPQTCKKSAKTDPNINYKFCLNSLQSAPDSHCAGLRKLGKIAIRLIGFNVTNTECYIKHLLTHMAKGGGDGDPYVKQCLMDCLDLYSNAIPTLKKAMRDYVKKRYMEANLKVSSVMDASTTCEDGFKEKRGVVSPLTKRNKDTFELSAMSLSIMNMLH